VGVCKVVPDILVEIHPDGHAKLVGAVEQEEVVGAVEQEVVGAVEQEEVVGVVEQEPEERVVVVEGLESRSKTLRKRSGIRNDSRLNRTGKEGVKIQQGRPKA
jgi:hypothetical protein